MALYSIRSDRQFCEQLQYNLLFKWFLGLNVEDAAFDPTTYVEVTEANGRAERETALKMLHRVRRGGRRPTVGADKGVHPCSAV